LLLVVEVVGMVTAVVAVLEVYLLDMRVLHLALLTL
jgi:hypothetical protein